MDINLRKRIVGTFESYTSKVTVNNVAALASLHPSIKPSGMASIYTFPFRIYSDERLSSLEGHSGDFKFKIHAPVQLIHSNTPMSPDINIASWPSFKWTQGIDVPDLKSLHYDVINVPSSFDKKPPTFSYDSMRIDVWGVGDLQNAVRDFSYRFLNSLRYLSGQPWINSFEVHNHSNLKYEFNIDDHGDCLQIPQIVRQISRSSFVNVAQSIWNEAFQKSLGRMDSPPHYHMWFDANISLANGNMAEAALLAVLSIEVCKNVVFQKIFPHKTKNNAIKYDDQSVGNTDLLFLLSKLTKGKLGRSLEEEQPETWSYLLELYKTRHQIAHGRNFAFRSGQGVVPLTTDYVADCLTTASRTIQWIETLQPTGI